MTTITMNRERTRGMTSEERLVIFASSLGTVFEWYDFYIYGTLAAILAKQFFSGVNATAAFIFTLLAFAAGFAVRPFGALVFGRIGDLVGRKYTFLITMTLMGLGTFLIGVLPSYASVGITAPVLLIGLRLVQGLALGGEYGGAAIYVAEHAPQGRRGFYTSWIQTTATIGLFMALLLILGIRTWQGEEAFADWGWRIPFLLSAILLVVSIWIRMQLDELPVFKKMKEEGKGSKAPLTDAFGNWAHAKIAILALFGATAGEAVVWYCGAVLRAVLPHPDAQGGRRDRQHPDRDRPPHRHARLHPVRLAVRQGRPQADHAARLRARRHDLLHAVPGPDPLRQPGARKGAGVGAGDRGRRPERVLVPIQPGRHLAIPHVLRHRQIVAGGAFGELFERGGAGGDRGGGQGRRPGDPGLQRCRHAGGRFRGEVRRLQQDPRRRHHGPRLSRPRPTRTRSTSR